MIRSFKELDVWRNAMAAAMEIFRQSKRFPGEERFSLTDQIRRSSRSVAAQLSEAWRKRRYVAAFVAKLTDAEGEAAETQTWILFARSCGYWDQELADDLDQRYEVIQKQLVRMVETADDWCSGVAPTRPPPRRP
ncbi:MAG TPA: four helix bundle protein [Tepidisphaeraceae bacterium]|nr:four helix bundle protein [Tepidisphaeraceae bacterium]